MIPTISRVINNQYKPRFSIGAARLSPTIFPCWIIKTITTAIAPVAPEIIPGLPPNTAVTSPIIKAPYSPIRGSIPAIKAKATASGTKAKATVRPDKISFFGFKLREDSSVFNALI